MADVAPYNDPDYPTEELRFGPYTLAVATAFGPRIVGLRFMHGPELFARLDHDLVIEHADSGTYRFHGGHRLWAAPEVPAITYASDDHPCAVTATANGFTVKAPMDGAGIIKQLRVELDGDKLAVNHRLENGGPRAISLAPWGITQLRLGGVGLIPIGRAVIDDPYQAVARLVIWPYTNLGDPRLSWDKRTAVITATPGARFKIGSGPDPGRIGYLIDRQLFTKLITPAGTGIYPDQGAVAQFFIDDSFCELESVGSLVSLEPGSWTSHREVWEVTDCADLATACARVADEGRG